MLREPAGLVERLAAGPQAATPVDQLRFLCSTCGSAGEPWVTSGDNRVEGDAKQLWPRR